MEDNLIIIEQLLDAPVSKVWTAISDKDEMKKWYFDLPDFEPKHGLEFQFMGGKPDGVQYLHLCEIVAVVPEKKLSYTWRYEGYEGLSTVSFELEEQGNKTLLRLTHSGIESFPADNPDLAISNFRAGWDQIINHSLMQYFLA